MSYYVWEDSNGEAVGYELFNLIASGVKILRDGLIYQSSVKPWPSMCGGRQVVVRPKVLTQFERDRMGEEFSGTGHPVCKGIVPNYESGLAFIEALVPSKARDDFMSSLMAYVAKIDAERGYRASVAFPSSYAMEYQKPDLLDHSYVYAIVSIANQHCHDEGETFEDGWYCSECDGNVDGDGYCEECDWVTDPPEYDCQEEDDMLTGNPSEDYESVYSKEATVSDFGFRKNEGEALVWSATDCWGCADQRGSSKTSALVHMGVSSRRVALGDELGVMALLRKHVVPVLWHKGPVLISSNIGQPSYATPNFMAALIRHRDELYQNGIELVRVKEHFATNPNERHHYIDGMALLPFHNGNLNDLMIAGGHVR